MSLCLGEATSSVHETRLAYLAVCGVVLACATASAWQGNPDQLLFVSDRHGQWDIYSVDVNGKNIRQLTRDFGRHMDPVWSPDGNHIAFCADRNGNTDIYVMQADGSDVALIDFEVVDSQSRRCPTDEGRVDFEVTGPVVWRGGLNAAKLNSTNNLYLDTECGINRVAIRSTTTPGMITVTAWSEGLTPATINIESKPVKIVYGLTTNMPQTLSGL